MVKGRKKCILKCQLCSPVTIDAKGTTLKGIEITLSEEPFEIEEKRVFYEDELEAMGWFVFFRSFSTLTRRKGYVYFEQGCAISGGTLQTHIMGDPVRFKVEHTIRILNDSLFLCGVRVSVGYDSEGQLQGE